MKSDPFGTSPTIGLIAPRNSLGTRIRNLARGRGLTLAFEVSPDDVENLADGETSVVVVVGPLEPREASLLRLVRTVLPETRIVACSPRVESPTIRWAIDNGADGVVWDSRLEESLELTIRAVDVGQVVVPRDLLRRMDTPDLTNREKQVLSMVIMGLTNHEIAEKLFVAESTVKSHLNTAYRKLGVHSRVEAQRVITDPDEGLGTGILAITASGLTRGRPPKSKADPS